ncbi:lipid-binding protein [Chryseobacterium sp.]|uniref:lipid-binding protein n=1 Tax=Chryseobacterium sp. TaxID=1871047 RepID=UPI0011C9AD96|nr:lipid-binding protein [Chryseobacterium sp.]TXF77361.1 hypothetical protein FUA25_05355 [Chryseobacterium sp.]
MKRKFLNILLMLSLIGLVTSCDRVGDGDVSDDQGGTSTQEMAGDWYVKFTVDGQDVYNFGYTLLTTYNTAANNGQEMWIDDHDNTYEYKVKTPINYSTKTFSGANLQNQSYDVAMTITEGKILKGAATTTGGNKSDSIVFKVEFADDPGTIYTVGGYKRTGFAEDEH